MPVSRRQIISEEGNWKIALLFGPSDRCSSCSVIAAGTLHMVKPLEDRVGH